MPIPRIEAKEPLTREQKAELSSWLRFVNEEKGYVPIFRLTQPIDPPIPVGQLPESSRYKIREFRLRSWGWNRQGRTDYFFSAIEV
jgi:hypothetical protein